MKTIPQIQQLNQRQDANPRAERNGQGFPQIDQNYQAATLRGTCGTPEKFQRETPFFRISNQYFAEEAPRSFAVDAALFSALIVTALLPIVNSVQAVAALVHIVGVL